MSFSPAFTISQTVLNPALIIAEDTSTGADAAIAGKRITFTTAYGTTLVESGVTTAYNIWATADNPKSFDVLTEDYALSINVVWVNSGGTTLYSSTQSYCLVYYNKQFMYTLVQAQALTPAIIQDTNYFSNMAIFWTTIVGAENAVEFGNDIAASQNMLNKGTYMRNPQSLYF